MAKVKKMAFGGIGRALKNAVKPAAKPLGSVGPRQAVSTGKQVGTAQQAPQKSPPTSIGKSPLDGFKNLPKMTGPLGRVGTPTMGKPVGVVNPNFIDSTNSTTTKDMRGLRNPAPRFDEVVKRLGLGTAMSGPKTGLGAAMSGTKQPLAQQRAQYDKNMAQAAALPAAQRAQFAQQFQKAAERKDPSTIRPGTIMGKPGAGLMGLGMAKAKMAGAGAALGKSLGMKSGGAVGSASKRADGIATKGKTKGKMI